MLANDPAASAHRAGRRLLEAVAVLHGRGYLRLRIVPYVHRSGRFWRCTLTTRAGTSRDNGALPGRPAPGEDAPAYEYSNAVGERYLFVLDRDAARPIASADALADALERRLPELMAAARGDDAPYVEWFAMMVDASAPLGLPWAFDDHTSIAGPEDPLPIAGGPLRAVPSPPPGDGEPV